MNILIVDDHEDTRRAVSLLLRRHGYSVSAAGSIADARELCDKHPFDLLIGDIELPDGSGLDLMRELANRCHLKGIAVTGHGSDDDIANTRAAGFAAHLIKPVSIDTLVKTIQQLLAETIG